MTSAAEYRRAIRAKCRDCSGSVSQAKKCRVPDCPLRGLAGWPERTPKKEKRAEGVQMTIKIKVY